MKHGICAAGIGACAILLGAHSAFADDGPPPVPPVNKLFASDASARFAADTTATHKHDNRCPTEGLRVGASVAHVGNHMNANNQITGYAAFNVLIGTVNPASSCVFRRIVRTNSGGYLLLFR